MINSSGGFLESSSRLATPPALILSFEVLPLSRWSACESVGSIFTSHEQGVSRVARPKVVRK